MSTNAQRRRTASAAAKTERFGMTAAQRSQREQELQRAAWKRNTVMLGPDKPAHPTRAQRRGHEAMR